MYDLLGGSGGLLDNAHQENESGQQGTEVIAAGLPCQPDIEGN